MVGDAVGFVDPTLTAGLCMAMQSAEKLVDALPTRWRGAGIRDCETAEKRCVVRITLQALRAAGKARQCSVDGRNDEEGNAAGNEKSDRAGEPELGQSNVIGADD